MNLSKKFFAFLLALIAISIIGGPLAETSLRGAGSCRAAARKAASSPPPSAPASSPVIAFRNIRAAGGSSLGQNRLAPHDSKLRVEIPSR